MEKRVADGNWERDERPAAARWGNAWRSAAFAGLALLTSAALLATETLAATAEAEQGFEDAQKAQKAGRTKDAIKGYEAFLAGAGDDDRVPWALVQIGDLHASEGGIREALEIYGKAVKQYPDSVDARLARSRMMQLSSNALATAHEKVAAARTEDERRQAQWEVGTIHEWSGDLLSAIATYLDIKKTTTQDRWKKKAADKLSAIVEGRIGEAAKGPPVPDEERWTEIASLAEAAEFWGRAGEYHLKLADLAKDPEAKVKWRLKAARDLALQGQTGRALVSYLDVIKEGPKGELLEQAYRGAGEAYEVLKQWGEAVKTYDTYLEAAGGLEASAWAWLRKSRCQERMGSTDSALRGYHELAGKYSKNPLAADALLDAGRIAEDRKEFDAAKSLYTRIESEFKGTPQAAEATVRTLGLASKAAEWAKVQAEISKMADKYSRRERKEP